MDGAIYHCYAMKMNGERKFMWTTTRVGVSVLVFIVGDAVLAATCCIKCVYFPG